ncbi:MAG: ATP-binding protein [Pseudomonadota bacterium]|nr:ATP-binding protein [Pseudomonadota bacterium]
MSNNLIKITEPDGNLPATARLIYMMIGVVGFIVIGIVGYGFYTGNRMTTMYTPLVDAAMEIKLEVTTAHLWFEEIISGDRHEDMAAVWEHLEQADWYAKAMLEGGENIEGTFISLDDNKLRRLIMEVQGRLSEFREITEQRIAERGSSGVGTVIDQRYDAVFNTLVMQADEVKTRLEQVMVRDIGRFRYTQLTLMLVCLSVFLFFGFIFHRFEHSRRNYFRAIRQANEKLCESESRYQQLFEESPISLWEEDFSAVKQYLDRLRDSGISDFRTHFASHPETVHECAQLVKIIDVNKATLEMFQAESKEVLLANLVQIFGEQSYEVFSEQLIFLILHEGKGLFASEAVNQTLQGREIHIGLQLVVASGCEGSWAKVLISLTDITMRRQIKIELEKRGQELEERVKLRTKELEIKTEKIEGSRKALTYLMEDVNASREALQIVNRDYAAANQELKEFAYIVSHDLKAPLRAISQLTHWISEDYAEVFDDDGREQIGLVLKRVKRMDGLIDGVLRYSRIGRVKEKEESLDLNLLVKEVIENLAPPDSIQIILENRLPVVLRDPTRMGQVFQNLIGNAIKFMDKDVGVIRVGCVDEGDLWKFMVADNGPGIDQRYHDKIFKIFQTLTARDEHESTGIGLTLVKKIITLYGGTIRIESEFGKGSSFIFTLPKK